MIFCGNCGLRLAPVDKQCPRCGTVVESNILIEEDAPPDAPTTASPSLPGRMQPPVTTYPAGPTTPANQQKIILRPGQDAGNYDYGTQAPDEATRHVDASNYNTAMRRPISNPGAPYSGNSPSGGGYSPQGASYPGYPQSSGGDYAPAPYQDFAHLNHQPYAGVYPPQMAPTNTNTKGRSTVQVIILLGLLLIIASMALFILQRNGIIGSINNGGNSTPIVTTALSTPEQQAQALIEQHYNYVNSKNYKAAYNLWKDDPQRISLAGYEDGYKNTLNDVVTFDTVTDQGDGTVKVPVTIAAKEKTADGSSTTNRYQGYYIVGLQNNNWKILRGILNKV